MNELSKQPTFEGKPDRLAGRGPRSYEYLMKPSILITIASTTSFASLRQGHYHIINK